MLCVGLRLRFYGFRAGFRLEFEAGVLGQGPGCGNEEAKRLEYGVLLEPLSPEIVRSIRCDG